jgi:hypothetical protein
MEANQPDIIPDASAGDWLVDRFAGNSTAGPTLCQGPAHEVGGLGRCGACPLPDGRVLLLFHEGVAEVDTRGTLRLVAEGRVIFATTGQVTANVAACNPQDRRVYLASEKMTSFENCDLIAARLDGYMSLDPAGEPVAASPLDEMRPALTSSGDGRSLLLYEKHQPDERVTIAGRLLMTAHPPN